MLRKILLSLFFLSFFWSCSSQKHPELLILEVIHQELEVLDHIESRVWKGGLSRNDLAYLGDDELTLASDPYVIQAVIDNRYLDLLTRYSNQMSNSELNELTMDQQRVKSLVKARERQSQMRIEIYKKILLKLYKMEGVQRERLNQIIWEYTQDGYPSYKQMISELTLSYYRNVPELNGPTLDTEPTFFTVKVDFGYTRGDKKMQTLINSNKMQLTDLTRHYFSQLTEEDLSPQNEFYIKTQLLLEVNRELLQFDRKGKLEGIQDIAIIKLQTFTLR